MKKLSLMAVICLSAHGLFSQYNTPWANVSSATNAGYLGLGTRATTTSTALPDYNFQVHGISDYTTPTVTIYDRDGNPTSTEPGSNVGKTARIGLTNSITGLTHGDGGSLRMSGTTFMIENMERADLRFRSSSAQMLLSGTTGRIWMGNTTAPSATATFALSNIITGDNGLYVKTSATGAYALSLNVQSATADAVQVFGNTSAIKTFSVQGSGLTKIYANGITSTGQVLVIENATRKLLQLTNDGILRAREVIIDLSASWPDYVFKPQYNLMPLTEVDQYIKKEGHLPNVPAAAVVEAEGINLSEMNTLLMEKVEELTLYLIQQDKLLKLQEARLSELEKAAKNK